MTRTPMRDVLLATVRRDCDVDQLRGLLADADLHALVDLAVEHRVGALVHRTLDELDVDVPARVLATLERERAQARARMLQSQRTVAALASALDVPFLVVKGPAVARWYRDRMLRAFSDVDVLVRRADFSAALEGLIAAGFREAASNWEGFHRLGVAEIPLTHESSVIDLHWHPLALAAQRRQLALPPGPWLDRAVDGRVGATRVQTTDVDDTLLHVCVNSGLSGARRLLQLVDVDRIVRGGAVDWDAFVARASAAGAGALACGVLQRAAALLHTPVPDEVLGRLQPFTGWLWVNSWIDDRQRSAARVRNGIASGVVLASGRDTVRETARCALRSLAAAAWVGGGGTSPTGPGGALAWHRSSPDPVGARGRYLTDVAHDRSMHAWPCRDAGSLHALVGHLQPRTTPLLGAALRRGLRGRDHRATLVRNTDGELAGALVCERWTIGGWTAYPVVVDPAAARVIGRLIDRSGVTDISGSARDVAPLAAHCGRWRAPVAATAVAVSPGFSWPESSATTRRAGVADVDAIAEIAWADAPHAFPTRRHLDGWVRRAVNDLVVVVETGDPPRVGGYAARESATPEYDHWAHFVVARPFRRAGLSWQLVAAAAAEARARRAGAMTMVIDSNPMTLPAEVVQDDPWWYVVLRPPNRVRGERRLRGAVQRLLNRLSRDRLQATSGD